MILVECMWDDVQLCEIVFIANGMKHYRVDEELPHGVRPKVIEAIRVLLQNGLIQAGFPPALDAKEQVWKYLSLPPADTIAYIEREWDKLGHHPSLGDVIWFTATEAGAQLAQEILAAGHNNVSVN